MNKKKSLIISALLAVLCVSLFAGVARANTPTTVGSIYNPLTYGYGNGYEANSNLFINYPDGDFAYIYGGNPNDGAQICGEMWGTVGQGDTVSMYGYSDSGYYSHIIVYVSFSSNGPWTQEWSGDIIGDTWTTFTASQMFNYMIVVGYDFGNSVSYHPDGAYSS